MTIIKEKISDSGYILGEKQEIWDGDELLTISMSVYSKKRKRKKWERMIKKTKLFRAVI